MMEKQKFVNYRLKTILFIMISILLCGGSVSKTYAKNEAEIGGTRVKVIKQDIAGKEQVIGCSKEQCEMHCSGNKYGDQACISGSDLLNIQVEIKEGEKIKYKNLYDCKFKSMQGGCIEGEFLYIAFSDKGKNLSNGEDLTAIVKINLTDNKVKEVMIVKGAAEKNIDSLGHANDLSISGDFIHAAWYQEKGKTSYSNKMGYINKNLENVGKSKKIIKKKENEEKSVFGVATYSNKKERLALAFRYKKYNKKGSTMQRYVSIYEFKSGKYKLKKRLFQLVSNKKFSATQCMEYYKDHFFIVRYNGAKGNNNCVEKYNKKGKVVKRYIIKDPNKIKIKTKEIDSNGNEREKTIIEKMKDKNWEIECLAHYKKNTFYYTQYKPSAEGGKQAYLYKVKIK
ncbi:MAG: hypothetical protein ACLRZ9_04950 [Eubacterium sp.]